VAIELATLVYIVKLVAEAFGAGKAAKSGTKLASELKSWLEDRPQTDDKKKIRAYVKQLDERRVFYVPLHTERANAVVASLRGIQNLTEQTKSDVAHHGLQAALDGIQQSLRAFLDEWQVRRFVTQGDGRHSDNIPFLIALGELRAKVWNDLRFIQLFDDRVKLTNIMPPMRAGDGST